MFVGKNCLILLLTFVVLVRGDGPVANQNPAQSTSSLADNNAGGQQLPSDQSGAVPNGQQANNQNSNNNGQGQANPAVPSSQQVNNQDPNNNGQGQSNGAVPN